jgi:hypothetical protein
MVAISQTRNRFFVGAFEVGEDLRSKTPTDRSAFSCLKQGEGNALAGGLIPIATQSR